MANGTTVAASVYYSDTTTYTGGAGSKTNPYCIEDLYDLINNPRINKKPNSEDSYYYYIVVNDIDMNDYDDYKYSPPLGILLYFTKMDFKNHELRNITIYNNTNTISNINDTTINIFNVMGHSTSTSIYNLKLTNYISYNSNVSIFTMCYNGLSYCKLYLYNCDFSIYADTSLAGFPIIALILRLIGGGGLYVYCYNCVFNIKANLNYSETKGVIINDSNLYMYYCHIHLYIIKNLYSLINGIGTFTSSYITGDIYGSTCYANSLIAYNTTTLPKLTNSYVNVNFHNTNPKNPTPIYGYYTTSQVSCGSAFFINKSKLEGFTACPANIANYYELTDEECKDVSKLQEIGFLAL